jgi:hypothetical protein
MQPKNTAKLPAGMGAGHTGPYRPPHHMDGPGGEQWQCAGAAPEVIAVNTVCDPTPSSQKAALLATSIMTAAFGATTIMLLVAISIGANKQRKSG